MTFDIRVDLVLEHCEGENSSQCGATTFEVHRLVLPNVYPFSILHGAQRSLNPNLDVSKLSHPLDE